MHVRKFLALEALLHEMGGVISIKDAQPHEVEHNDAFLEAQTRPRNVGLLIQSGGRGCHD